MPNLQKKALCNTCMAPTDECTYPVNFHDLEALRDVGGVGRQTRAPGDEAHEHDTFIIVERLKDLPEPLDELVRLIHLTVPVKVVKKVVFI